MNLRDALLYSARDREEYWDRVLRLVTERGMTLRAAKIVVDAAMYGKGCTEGAVRERIEKEKREQLS